MRQQGPQPRKEARGRAHHKRYRRYHAPLRRFAPTLNSQRARANAIPTPQQADADVGRGQCWRAAGNRTKARGASATPWRQRPALLSGVSLREGEVLRRPKPARVRWARAGRARRSTSGLALVLVTCICSRTADERPSPGCGMGRSRARLAGLHTTARRASRGAAPASGAAQQRSETQAPVLKMRGGRQDLAASR